MADCKPYYVVREVCELLGVERCTLYRRINNGTFIPPSTVLVKRRVFPVREFWSWCAKQESDGRIERKIMPRVYEDERRKFLGDLEFDNVLRVGEKR